MLGIREVFRGEFIKEGEEMSNERIDFSEYNKALVECGVRLCIMCWNKRCVVLHNPEVQKQLLTSEIKAIKVESRRGLLANFYKYVNSHPISEEIDAKCRT